MSRILRPSALLVVLLVLAACAPIQPISPNLESTAPPATAESATYPMVYAAPDCDYGGAIRSIEATDARTIKIIMCVSEPNLPYRVAGIAAAIQDADYLAATGGGGDLLTQPNGTGPFILTEWGDDSVTFERFGDYWGNPAASSELVISWHGDSAAALAALQAGEVDGIKALATEDIPTVEADDSLQLVTLPPQNVWYVGINNMKPPFDNERVRQAVAMAIDRDALVAEFFPEGSIVPTQVIAPQVPGYSEGEAWYAYDPEAAKAILAEEGVENLEIELTYWEAGDAAEVTQAIADQLAEVGITANVVSETEYEDYIGSLLSGEIGELDYIAWYPGMDPTEWYFLFARDAGLEFGEGYPDIWEALEASAALPDLADRQPIYDRVAQMIRERVPMVPVAHEAGASAYRADVTGINPNDMTAGAPMSDEKAGDRESFHFLMDVPAYSAYCVDEVDLGSYVICKEVSEGLTTLDPATLGVAPALATSWQPNEDMTEWTFALRDGVTFHDGSAFDADDVLASLAAIWDAGNPLHVGRTGDFANWQMVFGPLLNAPQE